MSQTHVTGGRKRRALRGWIAGGLSVALVSTVAVLASGYDAQEAVREDPSVWVEREAGQYARVNTTTGELDTVRKVAEPSNVVQLGGQAVLFSHGNGRAWSINAANPGDLDDSARAGGSAAGASGPQSGDLETPDAEDPGANNEDKAGDSGGTDADATPGGSDAVGPTAVRMPEGTRDVVSAGEYVVLRTETGKAFVGILDNPGAAFAGNPTELEQQLTSLRPLDPLASAESGDEVADSDTTADEGDSASAGPDAGTETDAETETFTVDAVAVTAQGSIVLYSSALNSLAKFNAVRGEFEGGLTQVSANAEGIGEPQLAIVGGDWVLFDADSGRLWRDGADEQTLEVTGAARLQSSGGSTGSAALIADAGGLWSAPKAAASERIVTAEGTPAQPLVLGSDRYAAWLGQSEGALWSGDAASSSASAQPSATQVLAYDESVTDTGEMRPVFRTNGTRAVLSESRSGMIWTLPEGRLIPLSQWTISDPPQEDSGTVVVNDVAEQVAPTAVDDAFGVRAGEPAPLPVLLNDFDANKRDVLTIVPESLGESALPQEFGSIELLPEAQLLTVRPAPGAQGSATFTYRITDGTLTSKPATVTLTVMGDDVNSAPEWCPVDGCQRAWTVPAINPGGTLVYPILEGWVDAEGDPMMLAGAEVLRPEDPARAIVTSDGRLALRHTDVNAGSADVLVRVTVRDSRGEERFRDLQVPVRSDATAEFMPSATTVQIGEATTLRPLSRLAGGSGSFVLVDAQVQGSAGKFQVSPRQSAGTAVVTAAEAGSTVLAVSFRDTVSDAEISGLMRVTATPGGATLAVPPLRAFVRPLADSTIEVLASVPSADSRSLSVQAVNVIDGQLTAEALEHSRVRVSGTTPDGGPGRIGSADITVTDGSTQVQTRLTVFQVPEASDGATIAVADAATVRAGSVVDIRVLDNDVSAPGERLILHPEVTGSGAEGELAFASGSLLRYLAPDTPGTYRLNYTAYGASSPGNGDVGTVTITVIPRGSNADPQPGNMTVRLAPGERVEQRAPLSGVDPDGDRVRLLGIGTSSDSSVTVSISADGSGVDVSALDSATPGMRLIEYSVRDDFGGIGTAMIRVIVVAAAEGIGAPVVSTDYVRAVRGGTTPVFVRPLDNDIDPARGKLEMVSVEPNVVGGEGSPEYAKLMDRLDLRRMAEGAISVLPGDELGTVSYRYTVRSSVSSSTADGLILVQTSERVGVQAPSIADTVLSVRDRSALPDEGIDVVTDRVRWAGGDVSALTLSLWEGNTGNYRVSGNRIVGAYEPKGDLVVFRLSGVDSNGQAVSSYGFLIVPKLDELRLTLRPSFTGLQVDENKSIDARVTDIVDLGPGDRLELNQTVFPVGRSAATCEATSADTIRYTAGAEAPWEDTCLIDVRVVGQERWTSLPIPVQIAPRAPIVELTSLTRTIAPGASETIDLTDMVAWKGNRAGDLSKLVFSEGGSPSMFEIVAAGTKLTVTARADATSGNQEGMTISVTGQGESSAPLTLRVGVAPVDAPRGATVSLQCTVGSSCQTTVVGVAGEYDPFAGKSGGGLTLDAVNAAGCAYGTMTKQSDSSVGVSWSDAGAPGGTCTIGYTVRDAQGRLGEGVIEFDALGKPQQPAAMRWDDFGRNSVTFIVELGAAQGAHPAVSGIEISGPGNASCSPAGPASYQCVVTGLTTGQSDNVFTARAVNSVGSSIPTTPVNAWAYASPAAPSVAVTQQSTPENTDPGRGTVTVQVTGTADVSSIKLSAVKGGSTQELPTISGSDGIVTDQIVVSGNVEFRAVPTSVHQPPPIKAASPQGEVGSTVFVVAGAPIIGGVNVTRPDGSTSIGRVTASGVNANGGDATLQLTYGLKRGNGYVSCSQPERDFPVQQWWQYRPAACAQTDFGWTQLNGNKTNLDGPLPAPTGSTYEIRATSVAISGGVEYQLVNANPVVPSVDDAVVYYSTGSSIVLDPNAITSITVWQCLDEETCSQPVALTALNAPTTVQVFYTGACVIPGDQASAAAAITVPGAASGSWSVEAADETGSFPVKFHGVFNGLQQSAMSAPLCETEPPGGETSPGGAPPTGP